MSRFTLPKDGGLITEGLPKDILHSFEKIPVMIYDEPVDADIIIADKIVQEINQAQALYKLGLSTGSTPVSLYRELVKRYKAGEVSFKNVKVFSIDEYYPLSYGNTEGRNYLIFHELLNHVDIKKENIFVPYGNQEGFENLNLQFDLEATGMDLLIVGIGGQGQIGFNEVGASEKSHTRTIALSHQSRKRQARSFNGDISKTPKSATTMGIGTMLSAKEILIMAWGENKAAAVQRISEGIPSNSCPASFLQNHKNITLHVDDNAASALTRVVAPWLVGPCEWTPKQVRKAVVWLCERVKKPILKLTQKDYLDNSLGELLEQQDSYDKINIKVFNDFQHTITGWPGGKPNSDDTTRPVSSIPTLKRVVVFSPHPDDDVISMGGTVIRLVEQGHDVHVAYETSGNVAVHDDVVLQHMDTAFELGFADKFEEVKEIINSKVPFAPEPRALLDLKGSIRRAEAKSALRSFGMNDKTNAHFLNLPFYETGGIKKGLSSQVDIDIVKKLLNEVKPHQIYVAGDLADPHGTHRVCTEVVLDAVGQLENEEWMKDCHLWLYRGAWMEWELGMVDMAVPLSPDELIKKRHAIYRHLSQKDIVPFPGDDSREFWQRAEERTQNTARLYDELGMAEYQAIEVFVRLF